MKCKNPRGCVLESGHKGKCVVNGVVNATKSVVNVSLGAYTPGCGAPVATKADLEMPTNLTVSRQVSWQQANRDRYNEKMREYMRRKRRGFIGIAYG